MPKPNRIFALIAAALAAVAAPLWAQANRTWVASTGVDTDPCTRTAPCRTFQVALNKTNDNGVVSCVDAGSYGNADITSPVTIDCTGTGGVILASGLGFRIDPPSNAPNFAVVIRGLEISGGASANPTGNGIQYLGGGGSLTVENVLIRNFTGGDGINFQPSLAARLNVVNTTIANNGNQSTGNGSGIEVDPSGPGYANVTLEDVRLIGNANAGLLVDVTGNTNSSTNVTATRSSFIAGRNGVSVIAPAGTPGATIAIGDSIVNGNIVNGLLSNGPAATIVLSNTAVSGNSTGIATQSGGIVGSYGNNRLFRNGVNGSFNGFLTEN